MLGVAAVHRHGGSPWLHRCGHGDCWIEAAGFVSWVVVRFGMGRLGNVGLRCLGPRERPGPFAARAAKVSYADRNDVLVRDKKVIGSLITK